MSAIKVQIDGKWVEARNDETILQVARRMDIDIPTLCHDDQLEPYGSCFVCVVQVEGARTLQPSCATKVRDGMVITTRNDKIEKSRKMALELLLSNHFADCLGPCKINCPAGVDVQGYVALAAIGKYKDAIQLIKRNNPLPTVCGRVCTRPCELNCRRNIVDEGVAVDDIKRFVADEDLFSTDRYFPTIKTDRKEKIAIVGSGPAGLSAAYYLAIEGYKVDIFEGQDKAGGMLRYGIPTYRLPSDVLDKEVEGVTGLGVNIHYNQRLGRDFQVDDLFKKGYKSIFLALGAQKSTHIAIEGENLRNVMAGIEFLGQVEEGDLKSLRGKVIVVGGGNTAIDAARTALRLGASAVEIVYRRTIKEMPANPEEIEAAQHEGIKINFLTNPKRYLGKNDKISGIECIRMELGEPDSSGRRRPVPVEGSEFTIEADYVIEAIGQKPDLDGLPVDGSGNGNGRLLKVSRWGTLDVNEATMETNIPGVFGAGDMVLGPATAIQAIAGGKKAANAIHHYITGKWIEGIKQPFVSRRDNFRQLTPKDYLKVDKIERHKRPEVDVAERIQSFVEVEKTFGENEVLEEAVRCLECGCKVFFDCKLQQAATEYEVDQTAMIGEFHEYEIDSRHPFIEFDLNKCILCGKCVRTCEEVIGVNALGLVNRGFAAKVAPSLEKPLQETSCISCGQCVDVCPTGAISDEYYTVKPGPWREETKKVVCDGCDIACEMDAHVVANQVVRITSREDGKSNPFGNICFKGRYGFRYAISNDRITRPHIRKNGELVPVNWDEALDALEKTVKANLAENQSAFLVSPALTLEEQYQIQKFARMATGSNLLVAHNQESHRWAQMGAKLQSNTRISEIRLADAVLIMGSGLMETHPVLFFELNKLRRSGKILHVAHTEENRLARKGNFLPVAKNGYGKFVNSLIQTFCNRAQDSFTFYKKYEDRIATLKKSVGQSKPLEVSLPNMLVLIWNPDVLDNKDLAKFLDFKALAEQFGWKFITLANFANPAVRQLAGMASGILPNALPFTDGMADCEVEWHGKLPQPIQTETLPELTNSLKTLWSFGIDISEDAELAGKLRKNIATWVVWDVVWNKTARQADFVFPMPAFFEKNGMMINLENRLLYSPAVVQNNLNDTLIARLAEIARRLDYFYMADSVEEVHGELSRLINWFELADLDQMEQESVVLSDFKEFKLLDANHSSKSYEFSLNGNTISHYSWVKKMAADSGITIDSK